jgi:small multidrug resistance pump
VALVALIGRVVFAEPLTPMMVAGIVLIIAGVLTIDLSGSLR